MITTTHAELAPSQDARQLEQSPESIPWPKRLELVKSIAEWITAEGPTEDIVSSFRLLAGDPKWEVRKEVADNLLLLSEGDFPKVMAILVDDSNDFVRRSARRALDRRQRGAEAEVRKRRSLDHIETQYAKIEKTHGGAVAQKARRMAERLYDVLVGATVHDMRNMVTPLESSILSLQKQLEDHRLEPSELAKHLPRMRRHVEWLSRMLDDMKTYSRCTPDSRRRERVEAIVEEAAAMARDTLKVAGRLPDEVQLEVDVPGSLTFVVARDHAVRAVMNIVKNAYEAFAVSPTEYLSGEIHVTARSIDSQRLEIVIKDNGQGLLEDDLAEVRRFLPGGTSKADFGTGFGLPTAKRMIDAHGGSLSIDSHDGEGTAVTITLPITGKGNYNDVPCSRG